MGSTQFKLIGLLSLAFAAAGLSLSSCTSEILEPGQDMLRQKSRTVELVADCGDAGLTKTVIQPDGKVWWSPGDAISLFFGSGTDGGSKFVSTNGEPSAMTTFSGTIDVITGMGEDSDEGLMFWGLYPYSPTAVCDGKSVTTEISSRQKSSEDTFSRGQFPTMGRSLGLKMSFYNICGGFKFTVTSSDIRSVTFKATGGESLSGKVSVGFDESGLPKIQSLTEGSDEVTVTPEEGMYFKPGKTYYAIVPPVTLSEGLTVTYKTVGQKATYTVAKSVVVSRSKFWNFTGRDAGLAYEPCDEPIEFGDPDFKSWCVSRYDKNGDGEVQMSEAAEVTSMDISETDADLIENLEGIRYFVNLQSFTLSGTGAIWMGNSSSYWSGNASILPALTEPGVVATCLLQSADFSDMRNLESIRIERCVLEQINLEGCNNLSSIYLSYTAISELEVATFTQLTSLTIYHNQLTSLDVSNNTALKTLSCVYNQLASLDVSKNTDLQRLYCYNNQLTSLDVSKNTALTSLDCGHNQLTSLDVSNNKVLDYLSCGHNQLTSLDISKSTALTYLCCLDNQLTSLDVTNNTALTYLSCYNNQLPSLVISKNTALQELSCGSNQLNSLDVSNNTALTNLDCSSNQLSSLDVSKNTALTYLSCKGNPSLSVIFISEGQTIKDADYDTDIIEIWIVPSGGTIDDAIPNGPDISGPYSLFCYTNLSEAMSEIVDVVITQSTEKNNMYYIQGYKGLDDIPLHYDPMSNRLFIENLTYLGQHVDGNYMYFVKNFKKSSGSNYISYSSSPSYRIWFTVNNTEGKYSFMMDTTPPSPNYSESTGFSVYTFTVSPDSGVAPATANRVSNLYTVRKPVLYQK